MSIVLQVVYVRNGMDESFTCPRKPHQSVGENLISSHSSYHCQMTQLVYIVSVVRTPMGAFMCPVECACHPVGCRGHQGLSAGSIDPNVVDEVFMGQRQAGGSSPARQAAMALVWVKRPRTYYNKVCSSE